MVVKAARALCKCAADACHIDESDNWKLYGHMYIEDARAALDAAGALDLLAELQEILSWAKSEGQPLREQEMNSIERVILNATETTK